jgi:hypothetical protein
MSTTPKFPPGWKVFPVKAGSKEPIEFGWAKEATDDPSQIEAWSIQYPDCNWGLACGPSGLAVIDIDPPVGEDSLFQFELERDFLPQHASIVQPVGDAILSIKATLFQLPQS